MFKGLRPIVYGGREVWPLIEGGKGVAVTNHMSSGAWAAAGGIGTVSAVNADSYDPEGKIIPQIYRTLTRRERHEERLEDLDVGRDPGRHGQDGDDHERLGQGHDEDVGRQVGEEVVLSL